MLSEHQTLQNVAHEIRHNKGTEQTHTRSNAKKKKNPQHTVNINTNERT